MKTSAYLAKDLYPLLRYCIFSILLVSLLASTYNKALVLVDYELNRNYIVSSFCINKKVPGSCCQGKCYLKKKLSKQENGEAATRQICFAGFDWICHTSFLMIQFLNEPVYYNMLPSVHLPFQMVSAVFHPPGMPLASV